MLLDLGSMFAGSKSVKEFILFLISSKASNKRGFNLYRLQKTDFKTKNSSEKVFAKIHWNRLLINMLTQYYMITKAEKTKKKILYAKTSAYGPRVQR